MQATFALEQAARNRGLPDAHKGVAQALPDEMGAQRSEIEPDQHVVEQE
jgi:hypothetical protein